MVWGAYWGAEHNHGTFPYASCSDTPYIRHPFSVVRSIMSCLFPSGPPNGVYGESDLVGQHQLVEHSCVPSSCVRYAVCTLSSPTNTQGHVHVDIDGRRSPPSERKCCLGQTDHARPVARPTRGVGVGKTKATSVFVVWLYSLSAAPFFARKHHHVGGVPLRAPTTLCGRYRCTAAVAVVILPTIVSVANSTLGRSQHHRLEYCRADLCTSTTQTLT